MQLKRMAFVAGMTVAATTGLAAQAWAAPADSSVTERQCFNGDGRVQREADGVGTCVGGTNDGLLIDDGIDHSDDADDSTTGSRYGRATDDDSSTGSRYGSASDDSSTGSRYGSASDDSSTGSRYGRATDTDDDRDGYGSSRDDDDY
jgi:hypothetical protein